MKTSRIILMSLSTLFEKALPRPSLGPNHVDPSKHHASKRGYEHKPVKRRKTRRKLALTNHERLIFARAKRMGVTVTEYERKFPKG